MDRRKIIIIFGGAWLSAALLTWFVFSRAANPKSEKLVQVVAAARDLPAGTHIRKADLKRMSVSANDAPRTATLDEKLVIDRVLLHPVSAGEPVSSAKLVTSTGPDGVSATIQPGMRAISVPINDASSAGGLIQPRSRVDVLFTRSGTMREAITSTIIQDVPVIAIGRITEAADPKAAQQSNQGGSRAATLMVNPEQAAKLELAKNQGKVSLALRNPLDRASVEIPSATAEALDPMIFAGAARAMRRSVLAGANVPNVRDNAVWDQLTEGGVPQPPGSPPRTAARKDPPKPRLVVDVYHGDKHTQEVFQ